MQCSNTLCASASARRTPEGILHNLKLDMKCLLTTSLSVLIPTMASFQASTHADFIQQLWRKIPQICEIKPGLRPGNKAKSQLDIAMTVFFSWGGEFISPYLSDHTTAHTSKESRPFYNACLHIQERLAGLVGLTVKYTVNLLLVKVV